MMPVPPPDVCRPDYRLAGPSDLAAVQQLLAAHGLIHEDVARHLHTFVLARVGGVLAGTAGLEVHGCRGLLRSVCVAAPYRGQAIGAALCDRVEALAASLGLRELYLLTTDAEAYFARRGYRPVDRARVPADVGRAEQFARLCPSTAVCMVRPLAAGAIA